MGVCENIIPQLMPVFLCVFLCRGVEADLEALGRQILKETEDVEYELKRHKSTNKSTKEKDKEEGGKEKKKSRKDKSEKEKDKDKKHKHHHRHHHSSSSSLLSFLCFNIIRMHMSVFRLCMLVTLSLPLSRTNVVCRVAHAPCMFRFPFCKITIQ